MKLLREQEPDCIAVAFDAKGPTFRHDAYDGYKATRKATPDALMPQIPFIKEIVRGFAIPVLEKQGIEADDIIGTIARRQAEAGMEVVIVSGDKDMMQLVSPEILMVDTMKEKTYDVEAVKERFGVGPEQVVEILGLMGDTSDNIPGVPGIGPKGAQRLIEQFGSIDAILAHPEQIHNAKVREAILRYADQARMSRELACIRTDAEFDFDLDACRRREPDRKLLMSLFKEFEFSSLLQELKDRGEETAGDYRIGRTPEEAKALAARLRGTESFSVELILSSPEAMRAAIMGLAISSARGRHSISPSPVRTAAASSPRAPKILKTIGTHPCRSAVPKARPGSQNCPHRSVRAQYSAPGHRLRYDGASYLLNPAHRGYRACRNGPGPSRPPDSLRERGHRKRRKAGRSFAELSVGKAGGLRLPPGRGGAGASRGTDREDCRGGDGGALPKTWRCPSFRFSPRWNMHGVLLEVAPAPDDVAGDRTAPRPVGGEDPSPGRGESSTSTPPSSFRRSSSKSWGCRGAGRPRTGTPRTWMC